MKGVTRFGRLPQGVNTKPRPSGPWRHRVAEVRPDLSYTIDEIAEAYDLDMRPAPLRAPSIPPPPGALPDVLRWMRALGMYQGPLGGGWHAITCPWVYEHTGGDFSGTGYREPAAENGGWGAFHCHHGHCNGRSLRHLLRFIDEVAARVLA